MTALREAEDSNPLNQRQGPPRCLFTRETVLREPHAHSWTH